MRLSVELLGREAVDSRLARIGVRAADAAPALQRVLASYRAMAEQVFDTEGSYGSGRPWAPLDPQYAARKAAQYPGQPINVRTGRLREAVVNAPAIIGPNSLTIRPNQNEAPYLPYVQAVRPVIPVPIPLVTRNAWVAELSRWMFSDSSA